MYNGKFAVVQAVTELWLSAGSVARGHCPTVLGQGSDVILPLLIRRGKITSKGMEDGAMQKAVQEAIADEAKAPAAPEEPEGGGGFAPSFKQPNQK